VQNFTSAGVKFETSAINAKVHNMEITGNGKGVWVVPGVGSTKQFGTYVPPWLAYLSLHDNNTYNLLGQSECILIESWLYGSSNPPAGKTVYGAVMNNQLLPASAGIQADVLGCVFGPGLNYGLVANGREISALGCLFIDAATANFEIAPGNSVQQQQYFLWDSTSFSTKKNAYEQGHYNILDRRSAPTGLTEILRNVVYGGIVGIPTSESTQNIGGNFQYAVTGNTAALAASQINPVFNTNVAAIADNASIASLINTDFSLSSTGPAYKVNAGANPVTSVAALKNTWNQAAFSGGGYGK
jgi:hypothetical protein